MSVGGRMGTIICTPSTPLNLPFNYTNSPPITWSNWPNFFSPLLLQTKHRYFNIQYEQGLVEHECRLTYMFVYATQRGQSMLTKQQVDWLAVTSQQH